MIIDFGNDGKGGGTSCKLQEVSTTITTNGLTSITPDTSYDGMSKVDVNVNVPEPYLVPLTVNSNGVYNPQEGEDGFSSVDVNVPAPEIKLQEKTTTVNGSVVADEGFDGLSKVNVNVAGGASATALDYGDIGYTQTDPAFLQLQSDLAYSKTKYDEWESKEDKTSASYLYLKDNNLVYAPLIDLSTCTNCTGLFQEAELLVYVPLLDLSSCTDCNMMFYSSSIGEVPLFDLSSCTNCYQMFGYTNLQTVPQFDLSFCTNCEGMYIGCKLLKVLPSNLTTSKVENFKDFLYGCDNIETIGEIDCSSVKAGQMMDFSRGYKFLSTLGGFKNLKVSLNMTGKSYAPIDKLTKESLMNVINDLAQADPAFEAEPTLTLHPTPFALLTPDDIKIATDKGWKVASA